MANHHLKDALTTAGLTLEEFADTIGVDPKTVQRWVNGRTPYPRHRETIARALDLTEHQLWPNATPTPDQGDEDRPGIEELTGLWPYGTDDGAPEAVDLLDKPARQVDILDPVGEILSSAELRAALRHQAATGHATTRIITAHNTADIDALAGQDHVEIITIRPRTQASIFIHVDDTILFNYALDDPDTPPILRLQRHLQHGLVDRLIENFDDVWTHVATTIGTVQPTTQKPQTAPPASRQTRHWPGREQ
jgi:transcriptional regulator with XRE-family HTH domain